MTRCKGPKTYMIDPKLGDWWSGQRLTEIRYRIKPVKDRLLERLVGCILRQHSFYLGQEVDWARVLPGLTEQLVTLGRIEMQSDPRRSCMWMPQLEKRKWPFWKRFRQGTVLIESGQAHFRDAVL